MDTPRTATPRPRYVFSSLTRSEYSSRHGTHHVAQKLTTTTLPLSFATASANPFASSSPAIFGASAASAAIEQTKARRETRTVTLLGCEPGAASGELDTLDRAAESLRLRLGDRLAGEQLVERIGQV